MMDWIPVTERLPGVELTPLSARVLVTFVEDDRPTVGIDQYDHYAVEWCLYNWRGVTAWRPLPEAYGAKGGA
jgi:hypothetical protein